jgi:hypothetical protein
MIMTNDFQTDAKALKFELAQKLWPKLHELPDTLSHFIRYKCVLSGGCFASILQGEEPKDYDFWCLNIIDLPELQSHMDAYAEKDSENIKVENPAYMDQFVNGKIVTVNATTLKNGIQLIKLSNYATAKDSFDFEHCRVSYIPETTTLYMSQTQYNSIRTKKLVPTQTVDMSNPATQRRVAKFTGRGWSL